VVDLISPEANRQKATVAVRVKVLKPDDLLKPEMNATVSFMSGSSTTQSATTSSAGRLIRISGDAVKDGQVLVIENGVAVARKVETGPASATGEVDVLSGLIGGEDLIVNAPAGLKAGDKVIAK